MPEAAAAPAAPVATPNGVVAQIAKDLAAAPPAKDDAKPPEAKDAAPAMKDAKADAPKDDAKKAPDAKAFVELTKKEAKLVHREQGIKAAEAKLAADRTALDSDLKELTELRALKNKPLKLLQKLGLSYDQITEAQLAEKMDPEAIVDAKLRERDAAAEKQKQADVEAEKKRQQEQYDATIQAFRDECVDFVKNNAETYELTALHDGGNLVMETIQHHLAQTSKFDADGKLVKSGKLLSFAEAAALVEKQYEEQLEKLQATKKFQAKQAAKATAKSADPKAPPPKTISNDLGSGAAGSTGADPNPHTDPVKRAVWVMEQQEAARTR